MGGSWGCESQNGLQSICLPLGLVDWSAEGSPLIRCGSCTWLRYYSLNAMNKDEGAYFLLFYFHLVCLLVCFSYHLSVVVFWYIFTAEYSARLEEVVKKCEKLRKENQAIREVNDQLHHENHSLKQLSTSIKDETCKYRDCVLMGDLCGLPKESFQ